MSFCMHIAGVRCPNCAHLYPHDPYLHPPVFVPYNPPTCTPHRCPVCEGSGRYTTPLGTETAATKTCHACGGTGVVWEPRT